MKPTKPVEDLKDARGIARPGSDEVIKLSDRWGV